MSKAMRATASGHSRPLIVALPSPEAGQTPGLPTLHRAAWLVPVAYPPLNDGAVLVQDRAILAAGPYRQVRAASPPLTREVDHGFAAILPGLVNAHTHLELSGVRDRIGLPKDDFAQWLTALLALRPLMTREFLEQGLAEGREELVSAGCCLCGDITNGVCLQPEPPNRHCELPAEGYDRHLLNTQHPHFTRQAFLEVLGFDRKHLAGVLDREAAMLLERLPVGGGPPSLAAHACYSTAGPVIREAKDWCRVRGRFFSMHVAEHPQEIEFLEHGTGFCRDLLETLGRWADEWLPPRKSPVGYLEELQVLDAKTLLVHAVHLTDDDWELVVRNQCPVCFCPRSNRNLRVGQPAIGKALRFGLTVALGTDSLASNTDFQIFAEAVHVLDGYPDVSAEAAIHMVTLGGARALGCEHRFGSIEPGKRAALLVVSVPASLPPRELYETILQQGNKGAWQWLEHRATRCD